MVNPSSFEKMLPFAAMVPLSEQHGGLVGYVFPLGVRHMFKWKDLIQEAIERASKTRVEAGMSDSQVGGAMVASIIPVVLGEGLKLIADCVVLGRKGADGKVVRDDSLMFEELPHWDAGLLAEKWIEMNFEDEKSRSPWVRAASKIVALMTGGKKLSDFFSKKSSEPVTPSMTSSSAPSAQPIPTG